MLIKTKIITTTHWLGDVRSDSQVRMFRRTHDNDLAINDLQWRTTMAQAASDLAIVYDKLCPHFSNGLSIEETEVFTRTYNRINKEKFEAVKKGTEIELSFVLDEGLSTCELPSREDVMKILAHVGEFLGLSPWGCKFQYGRFKIGE